MNFFTIPPSLFRRKVLCVPLKAVTFAANFFQKLFFEYNCTYTNF